MRFYFLASALYLILNVLLIPTYTHADSLLLMDETGLQKLKTQIKIGELSKTGDQAYAALLLKADETLSATNPTVIDKTLIPPTKDKRDYLSISRYWWPDPSKEDGLPWIRKDGITNPDTQTDAVDRPRIGRMTKGVKTLALSYYLSDQTKYAEKAASMLRTWFLDKNSGMHPHLKFAQSVPGNPKSRRAGILDGRLIPEHVLDSISLIKSSGYWTKKDDEAMNKWLSDYLSWLTDSKVGKQGAKQMHNHGSWYRFQVAAIATYLDDEKRLHDVIEATKSSLDAQFTEAGEQPHETKRTRSFFYSCFNLSALAAVATVAEKADKAFWSYESQAGKSMQLGFDYLTPIVEDKKDWPHPNNGIDTNDFTVALVLAYDKYPSTNYADIYRALLQQALKNDDIHDSILLIRPEHILLSAPDI